MKRLEQRYRGKLVSYLCTFGLLDFKIGDYHIYSFNSNSKVRVYYLNGNFYVCEIDTKTRKFTNMRGKSVVCYIKELVRELAK